MSEWFNFFLKKQSSVAEGLEELLSCGAEDISVLEEAEKVFFCARAEREAFPKEWKHIEGYDLLSEEINWTEQWELFCPYFVDGMCKIPLSNFSSRSEKDLLLTPGAGFGDLSHPTTFLMMQLIDSYVEGKVVVDLGCGSGVLGLFSLLLGSKKMYGIDIDLNALEHTKENGLLNGVGDKVFVGLELPDGVVPEVTLLNMTWEEQRLALASFPVDRCDLWITSGILEEQEEEYLFFMEQLSLKPQKVTRKEGWLGFVFVRSFEGKGSLV